MAPEQVSGEKEDERTDLYGAGNILYEMATGQRPFYRGRDSGKDILYSSPKPPSQLEPLLNAQFDEIVLKCLEKDPDDRYQTAKDLQVDLRRLGAKKPPVPDGVRGKFKSIAKCGALALVCLIVSLGIYHYWVARVSTDLPRFRPWEVSTGEKIERQPAISPDGMKIVFIQRHGSGSQICIIPYNGGASRPIIDPVAEFADPAWFPSSNYIAYAVYQGGQWKIYGRAESGDEESMLVENARHPAISPDGKRIAFTRLLPDGKQRIGVASLEGFRGVSDIRTITGDQDGLSNHTDPAWSWDSKQICYRTGKGLWVIPADPGKSSSLTESLDNDPVWSPGGMFVYYSSAREGSAAAIWRVEVNGRQVQRVTTGPGPADHPSISRNGMRLAFCSEDKGYSLFLADLSSGQDIPLPQLKGARVAALSPKGDKIAAVMQKGDLIFYCMYIQDIERGTPKPTLHSIICEAGGTPTFPAFSPDSKYLVYSWSKGEDMKLWTVATEGGTPYCLTAQSGKQQHPAWSSDGSEIAYISVENGRNTLCVLPVRDARPSGSVRTLDTEGVEPYWPAWSGDGEKIAFLGRKIVGAGSEEYAIWEIGVHGKAQVRPLTAGDARAKHAHWLADTHDLLVSGLWGDEQYTLRRISSDIGMVISTDPLISFGRDATIGHFDVSRDGRWLLYLREEELRGRIFLQEAFDIKY
jgi:Tol biopolymer transport system component